MTDAALNLASWPSKGPRWDWHSMLTVTPGYTDTFSLASLTKPVETINATVIYSSSQR